MTAKISSSHYSCARCYIALSNDQIKRCGKCREAIYCSKKCQVEHWKTAHRFTCLSQTEAKIPENWLNQIFSQYTKDNILIRKSLQSFENQVVKRATLLPQHFRYLLQPEYNHPRATQEFILEGAGHLRPDESVVIVCGAQFLDQSFLEPLPFLLERCKKLILTDVDPQTLKSLHQKLGESPKVKCVELDFTDALRKIPFKDEELQCSSPTEFFNKANNFLQTITEEAKERARLSLKEIEKEDRVDYVISSLVSSQLGVKLKQIIFHVFTEKLGYSPTSLFSKEQYDQLAASILACNDLMAKNHVLDICSWAGARGNIYYADTFRMGATPMISDSGTREIMTILSKKEKTLVSREWTWVESNQTYYPVKATLLIGNSQKQ